MEITKEQIEEVLRSDRTYDRPAFAQGWTDEDDETFTREVLKLALAHLDSTRARRVGEAVIAVGETGVWMVDEAIDSMRNGVGFDADDMPKLLAIRAALRGEP